MSSSSSTSDSGLIPDAIPDPHRLNQLYQVIKTPLHARLGLCSVEWKNETNSIGRRFVCGAALAGLAFAGIIDMITGLAIGILSSPFELCGYQFTRHAFERVYFGAVASLAFLSVFQLDIIKGNTGL